MMLMLVALLTTLLAQSANSLEAAMLDNDKLFVVLAVVLIIWAGVLIFVYSTDRKLARLERRIETIESSRI